MTIVVKSILNGGAIAHRALDQQHALTLAVYARAMGAREIVITQNGIEFDIETYKSKVTDVPETTAPEV